MIKKTIKYTGIILIIVLLYTAIWFITTNNINKKIYSLLNNYKSSLSKVHLESIAVHGFPFLPFFTLHNLDIKIFDKTQTHVITTPTLLVRTNYSLKTFTIHPVKQINTYNTTADKDFYNKKYVSYNNKCLLDKTSLKIDLNKSLLFIIRKNPKIILKEDLQEIHYISQGTKCESIENNKRYTAKYAPSDFKISLKKQADKYYMWFLLYDHGGIAKRILPQYEIDLRLSIDYGDYSYGNNSNIFFTLNPSFIKSSDFIVRGSGKGRIDLLMNNGFYGRLNSNIYDVQAFLNYFTSNIAQLPYNSLQKQDIPIFVKALYQAANDIQNKNITLVITRSEHDREINIGKQTLTEFLDNYHQLKDKNNAQKKD